MVASRIGASSRPGVRAERGQSEILGLVLLIGLTVVGITVVVAAGSSMLREAQQDARTDSVEHAMTSLDSKASLVAHGSTTSQRIRLGHAAGAPGLSEGHLGVDPDAGWIRVTIVNATGSYSVFNVSLGAFVYEDRETTIAYQGGGVWRGEGNRSVMVSPPEVHYRGDTLTLPIIRVDPAPETRSGVLIRDNGTEEYFPDPALDLGNPVHGSTVRITVGSEYYTAWAGYFEERTDGDVVDTDHANESVTVALTIPSESVSFGAALTGVGSGLLKLETGGTADTYDSDIGPYAASSDGPADIRTRGDVTVENTIEGNVYAKGDITVEGTLDGDACAEGSVSGAGTVTGWTNGTTCEVTIAEYPLADDEIAAEISAHSSPGDNDNGGTSCISGNTIVSDCTGGDTLTAGTYYLADGAIENKDVDLDTSGGEIDLVVDDDVLKLAGTTSLDIVNANPTNGVTLYVDADLKVEGDVTVATDANQSAEYLTFKVHSDRGIKFETGAGSVSVVGVVYAPGSGCGPETMKLETGAEIYGALVVDCPDKIETVGTIHHDTDLGAAGSGVDVTNPISYLHVSVNRVRISAGGGSNGAGGGGAMAITGATAADATDGDGTVDDGDAFEVSAAVSDPDGIASVTADGSDFGAGAVALTDGDGDGTYDATLTVDGSAASPDGSYPIAITATDAGGQTGTADTNTLTLDTGGGDNAPSVTIQSTSATDAGGGTYDVTVDWEASDADADLADATITITDEHDGSTASTTVGLSGGVADETTTVTITLDGPPPGRSYAVEVTVEDGNGNTDTDSEPGNSV